MIHDRMTPILGRHVTAHLALGGDPIQVNGILARLDTIPPGNVIGIVIDSCEEPGVHVFVARRHLAALAWNDNPNAHGCPTTEHDR